MRTFSRFAAILILIGSISGTTKGYADSVNFADTEPPTVDLLQLSNQAIEVSKSANKLLIDISASDNLNSLEYVYVSIYRETPGPQEVGVLGTQVLRSPISTKIDGGRVTSKYQTVFEIPKGFASGRYYVYSFARDMAGNYPRTCENTKYCVYSMSKVLPEALFEVKNDGSGKTIDVSEFDLNAKYSDISQRYDALTKSLSGLQSQIATLTNEKSLLQNQVSSISNEKSSLQSQVTSINESLFTTKKEFAALQKRIMTICKARPRPRGC